MKVKELIEILSKLGNQEKEVDVDVRENETVDDLEITSVTTRSYFIFKL